MANPVIVACPECQKQFKASDDLAGKKVRCKGCGHIFVITLPGGAKPGPGTLAPAKAQGGARPAAETQQAGGGYGLAEEEEETVVRCPHCAKELENPEARYCIHCGFDTVTRRRVETRKVVETTPAEHFMWLLPGIACVVTILFLIGADLVYCLLLPDWLKGSDNWEWTTYKGFRLWFVIMSLFGMFFAGKFAINRLIRHPTPPERTVG